MGKLGTLVRRWAEKLLGQYYEGPEMPERYREAVLAFSNEHPRATLKEWVEFSQAWAEVAYKAGFRRGYENVEREENPKSEFDPEVFADAYDPDWRWRPAMVLEGNAYRIVSAEEVDEVLPNPDEWFEDMLARYKAREVKDGNPRF